MLSPRIALTHTGPARYLHYPAWLRRHRPEIQIIDLATRSGPLDELRGCHGLLLPGGPDVDPVEYRRPELRRLCRTIDAGRDRLELRCAREAAALGIPLLGVCRGLQIANVALGGTLVADLPPEQRAAHDKLEDQDRLHDVRCEEGSLLARLAAEKAGAEADRGVNSAHHQAADTIAPELRVSARSIDGVIEALEWREPEGKPFLLLVQWHPERMAAQQSGFSRGVALAFLDAAQRATHARAPR
jgi:putative glutamine amidotransferase